ncbi:MAG: DUF1573 domain-containing protein [Ferruginibacter sp.]
MKNFIFCCILGCFFTSCDVRNKDKQSIEVPESNAANTPTTVQVIDRIYDFGEVAEGEIVEFNFRFKNTGSSPLVVTNVAASCGCTVPEKPEQPIRPGEIGFIKAKFDSAKRPGEAMKTITVTSNAAPPFPELVLKGKVLPKKTT